jgi:hypothetical protein
MSRVWRFAGWVTGVACLACCLTPLIVLGLASAGLAALAAYSELIAVAMSVLAAGAFLIWRSRRRVGAFCKVDRSCKPGSS